MSGGKTKYISFCNKFKYDNMLCIQRHVVNPLIQPLSCVPKATTSVPANTCCMSTDTAVYLGIHVVFLQAQLVLDV